MSGKKKRTLTYDQRNDNKRRVPEVTERAMRACHLFAKILKDHFDDGTCELMEENSYDYSHFTADILNNLLLVGDVPRDILLGTAVKVIDITFNLRELTKVHLNHLTKYHSKKENQRRGIECVYFQHYLNKFEHDETDEEEEVKGQGEMLEFHRNPYIFNAQYFVDILECSHQLQYKVDISDIPQHGCFHLTINREYKHEGYDLNGVKCRFTDTFDPNTVLSVQKQKQNELMDRQMIASYQYNPDDSQEERPRTRTRWKSITLAPQGMNYADEFDDNYKPVEIEVYGTRIEEKLKTYDFSINTAMIPLYSVTEFFNEDKDAKEENIAIWFWEYIIENGIDECDAINDTTVNRVLRVPQPNKEKYIINVHGGTYHFWRTVELMIRLPNFYIDDALVEAHIAHYDHWLNMDYFSVQENRVSFIDKFVNIVVNYCYCVKDLRAMMNVLEILEFNEAFSDLLIEFNAFNHELMAAIKSRDYEELTMVIFISYGYPFKMTPDKEITDELGRLKTENLELKQEIFALEQSKVTLAVNCTKAIDEFRSYFVRK
eukprot:147373_1